MDSGVASGGTRPGAQALRAQQHIFAVILNVFLSRNLDQSMIKNEYFWEKSVKIVLAVGGSAPNPSFHPQTPALLLPPTIITALASLFLVLDAYYSAQKRTK